MSEEGILQKVSAPCLRCNNEVNGFLIPDGRFICPNCDPPAVYERWKRTWEPHEKAQRRGIRKRLQFRLSTALVLMVLASVSVGVLIFAYGLYPHRESDYQNRKRQPPRIAEVVFWNLSNRTAYVYFYSTPDIAVRYKTMMGEFAIDVEGTYYETDHHYQRGEKIDLGQHYDVLELRSYFKSADGKQEGFHSLNLLGKLKVGKNPIYEILPDGSICPEDHDAN